MAATAPRRPLILFGLLSAWTLIGPLVIFLVGRGGSTPFWPPDRPVEWVAFVGSTALFIALFVACIADAARAQRRLQATQAEGDGERRS